MDTTKPLIITISRQLGSGGAYIGQQLARRLNINFVDREIISKAAEELAMMEEELESRDEKLQTWWESFLHLSAYATDVYIPPHKKITPTDYELYETQCNFITHFVKDHSAVIMGRCGSYILRDCPNHVSIFFHSNIDSRNKRLQGLYNLTEKDALEILNKNDKERSVYNKTFTGRVWTDARWYDLSIDTGKIGFDKSIELVLSYLNYI
jgi:cytidylate kinase